MRHDLKALPVDCDLRQLGIDPTRVTSATQLKKADSHRLYRLTCGRQAFVLKWFADPDRALEPWSYALLREQGVPTLPVHGRSGNALLLEDLATSNEWRLATEEDLHRPEVGIAVAEWYLALHAAGRTLLADGRPDAVHLHYELDALDAEAILRLGERLGLGTDQIWRLAADHIDALKRVIRALPPTLTYNDFHWTNLALTREWTPTPRAVVFDYHLVGIGPAYSDVRNVTQALGDRARRAFLSAYGPIGEREVVLDAPASVLHALHVAAQISPLPRWASMLVHEVTGGTLEANLRMAIAILDV